MINSKFLELRPTRFKCPYCGQWHNCEGSKPLKDGNVFECTDIPNTSYSIDIDLEKDELIIKIKRFCSAIDEDIVHIIHNISKYDENLFFCFEVNGKVENDICEFTCDHYRKCRFVYKCMFTKKPFYNVHTIHNYSLQLGLQFDFSKIFNK